MAFIALAGGVNGMIKEGKVKALGIASQQPSPLFPNLPTLSASKALDKFEFDLWAGLLVARSTPDAVMERLNKAVTEALQNPEVRKAYESTGSQVGKPMSVAELQQLYTAEIARYQAVAKSANVQPQ
jgi:tripartite-type tricarboxylate transporter receptor subunit TctC